MAFDKRRTIGADNDGDGFDTVRGGDGDDTSNVGNVNTGNSIERIDGGLGANISLPDLCCDVYK